ncbi:RND transporter [Nitrospirota bacterium]
MESFINKLSWDLLVIACLTLGLAPFMPEPHIVEKLRMLFKGTLSRPVDWFDLVMHGTPWVLLVLKAVFTLKGK